MDLFNANEDHSQDYNVKFLKQFNLPTGDMVCIPILQLKEDLFIIRISESVFSFSKSLTECAEQYYTKDHYSKVHPIWKAPNSVSHIFNYLSLGLIYLINDSRLEDELIHKLIRDLSDDRTEIYKFIQCIFDMYYGK